MKPDSAPELHADCANFQIETPSITESRRFAKWGRCARSSLDDRLRVGDWLLWLTFVGVYLGIAWAKPEEFDVGSLGLLILLAQATVAGASWAGLSLGISRALRGIPRKRSAGHWLLIVLGVRIAGEVLLGFKPGEVFVRPDGVVLAITCCALVLPILDSKLPAIWRVTFATLVLVFAIPLIQICLGVWFTFTPTSANVAAVFRWLRLAVSPSLPLLASVWMACRGRRDRGLHWVGVAMWIAWHALQPAILDRLF